eukprot:TRINITY_DN17111_c0_g1_i1.p1 TRINITY_DN17111_c0_g1~~TRINITY_DN17111_c0_g1_i1.p1  ORF type:complete len:514 (-),score=73.45 TRINITY_DN17111_c0_g1_i1:43-1584(-)
MKRAHHSAATVSKKPKEEVVKLDTLPYDTQILFLEFLRLSDIKSCRLVCKSLERAAANKVIQVPLLHPGRDVEDLLLSYPALEGIQYYDLNHFNNIGKFKFNLEPLPGHRIRVLQLWRFSQREINLGQFSNLTKLDIRGFTHSDRLPSHWAKHLRQVSIMDSRPFNIDLSQADKVTHLHMERSMGIPINCLPPNVKFMQWIYSRHDTVADTSDFKNLTSLVRLTINQNMIHFDSLPPNLEYLEMEILGCLDDSEQDIRAQLNPTSLSHLDKLQELHITALSIDMNPIIRHLSPSIRVLKMFVVRGLNPNDQLVRICPLPNLIEFHLNIFSGFDFLGFRVIPDHLDKVSIGTEAGHGTVCEFLKSAPIRWMTFRKFAFTSEAECVVNSECDNLEALYSDLSEDESDDDGQIQEDPRWSTTRCDVSDAACFPPTMKVLTLSNIRGREFYHALPRTPCFKYLIIENGSYPLRRLCYFDHPVTIVTDDTNTTEEDLEFFGDRIMSRSEWEKRPLSDD